jgi:hypothetical protein
MDNWTQVGPKMGGAFFTPCLNFLGPGELPLGGLKPYDYYYNPLSVQLKEFTMNEVHYVRTYS